MELVDQGLAVVALNCPGDFTACHTRLTLKVAVQSYVANQTTNQTGRRGQHATVRRRDPISLDTAPFSVAEAHMKPTSGNTILIPHMPRPRSPTSPASRLPSASFELLGILLFEIGQVGNLH